MSRIKVIAIFSILFVFLAPSSKAQLAGWSYQDVVVLDNRAKTGKSNNKTLLIVPTKEYVDKGQMAADGKDIRFASDCNGSNLLSYFIEKGMNSMNTRIWVVIPSIPSFSFHKIYMFYGNPSAPAASNFNAVFPVQQIFTTNTTIAGESIVGDWVEVKSGVTLTLDANHSTGKLSITGTKILINGTLQGSTVGHEGGVNTGGQGPGGGQRGSSTLTCPGGGGGYGANGGKGAGSNGGNGGIAYGASGLSIDIGSGGGAPCDGGSPSMGGNGGGAFDMRAQDIELNGTIIVDGGNGTEGQYTGGGGSGGGVLFAAGYTWGIGIVQARGGRGGNDLATANGLCFYGGGGGAGGRFKLFYDIQDLYTGSVILIGGAGGSSTNSCKTLGDNGLPGTKSKNVAPYSSNQMPHQFLNFFRPSVDLQDTLTCSGDTIHAALKGAEGAQGIKWFLDSTELPDTVPAIKIAGATDSSFLWAEVRSVKDCGDTSRVFVTTKRLIKVRPAPDASFTNNRGDTAGLGQMVCFEAQNKGQEKYRWDFGDFRTSRNTDTCLSYDFTGTYYVRLIVSDSLCGTDTIIQPFVVVMDSTFGINSGLAGFKLYPNPVRDMVVVEPEQALLDGIDLYGLFEMVQLTDIQGRTVHIKGLRVQSQRIEFEMGHLPKAVYLLHLGAKEMRRITVPLIRTEW